MAEAEKSAAMPHLIPPHLVPPAEEDGAFLLESETALKEFCSGALVSLHPGGGTMAEAEKSAAMSHLIPPHLVPPAEEDGAFLLESETALKEFCSGALISLHPGVGSIAEAEKDAVSSHLVPQSESALLLETGRALQEIGVSTRVYLRRGGGSMAEAEKVAASSHLVPPSESPVPLESGRVPKVCGVKPKPPLAEMGRVAGRFIHPPTGKKSGTSERGRHVRRRRDL
jgi:hypothetical protein